MPATSASTASADAGAGPIRQKTITAKSTRRPNRTTWPTAGPQRRSQLTPDARMRPPAAAKMTARIPAGIEANAPPRTNPTVRTMQEIEPSSISVMGTRNLPSTRLHPPAAAKSSLAVAMQVDCDSLRTACVRHMHRVRLLGASSPTSAPSGRRATARRLCDAPARGQRGTRTERRFSMSIARCRSRAQASSSASRSRLSSRRALPLDGDTLRKVADARAVARAELRKEASSAV